jgi:hypothetical protein
MRSARSARSTAAQQRARRSRTCCVRIHYLPRPHPTHRLHLTPPVRTAPPRGTDPAEDAARDAALAAYRATKRAASTAVAAAAGASAAAEETKQRALVELARLAHEIDPSLRPVVAYRTALTMYVAQRQTLGG